MEGCGIKELELALYVIELKISFEIKNNKLKKYSDLHKRLSILEEEKMQIYKNNKEIINKVLKEYLPEIKGELGGCNVKK